MLYLAGSLKYRRIKQLCFNAPYLQCKSTLYTVFRCILQLLTRQYNVEKSSFKLLYIEYRVYGYILIAGRVLNLAGSLRYCRIKELFLMHLLCYVREHCIQFFDVYYSCLHGNITLKKAASNSCILNIEYMATFWVQVQCCIWQDPCDIVG